MGWLRERFAPSPRELVTEAIILLVAVGTGTAWAAIQGAGPWLPLIIVGLVSLTLLGINQAKTVFERRRTDREWALLFIEWLSIDRNFEIRHSDIGADQMLIVAEDANATINIRKQRTKTVIGLTAGIEIDDENYERLSKGPPSIRQRLYDDLAIELTKLPDVEVFVEAKDALVRRVSMTTALTADSTLTEFIFARAVSRTISASILANRLISRAMRDLPSTPRTSGGRR